MDRRFLCRIEGEIGVLAIPGNETASLQRSAESLGDGLHQGAELLRVRRQDLLLALQQLKIAF